eukprot:822185_1
MSFHQENKNATKKAYPRSSGLSQHPYTAVTAPSLTKTRSKLLPAISTQRNTSKKQRPSTKQNPNQEENVSMMLNMDRTCIKLHWWNIHVLVCILLFITLVTSVTVYSIDCKAAIIDMIAEKVVERDMGIIKAADAIKYSTYLSQTNKNSIYTCDGCYNMAAACYNGSMNKVTYIRSVMNKILYSFSRI